MAVDNSNFRCLLFTFLHDIDDKENSETDASYFHPHNSVLPVAKGLSRAKNSSRFYFFGGEVFIDFNNLLKSVFLNNVF